MIVFPEQEKTVDSSALTSVGGLEKYSTLDGDGITYIKNILADTVVANISIDSPVITGSGSLTIGTGDNVFVADANGLHLGNASFGSAPFRVDMTGHVVANDIAATGSIQSSSGNDRIVLSTGDVIQFYKGGGLKGQLSSVSTGGHSGIITDSDIAIPNDKTYLMSETDGSHFGRIGVNSSNQMVIVLPSATGGGTPNQFFIKNAAENVNLFTVSATTVSCDVDLGINGHNLNGIGEMYVGGHNIKAGAVFGIKIDNGADKNAIVPTTKGFNALYSMEAPEVWFMDFCWGKKVRKWPKFWQTEWIFKPDAMFMEVVEGKIVVVPTGMKEVIQIWGHRKGHSEKRFESKTKEEFDKNEAFLRQSKV